VTDPQAWFQDNNRWAVPEDPNNGAKSLQPPYRMFVTQPSGLVASPDNPPDLPAVPTGQVWSMTSTFVPYKRSNLAAYVSVDSDATSDTYGQIRVIDVIDQQQQGPSQVANNMRSDPQVSTELAQFNRSGNSISYGNLLTVPVGDELLYVEPVYVRLATANEANFPILRNVLVSYKGGVGIGQSLETALDAALEDTEPVTPSGSPSPSPSASPSPSGSPSASPSSTAEPGTVQDLLDKAQKEFVLADQALKDGDLSAYQEHIQNAQDYVNQALALENGGSASSSSSPSGSPSPSPSP
jgi:hypothetical protein